MIEIGWGWIALIAFVSFLGGAVGLMVYAVWDARRRKRKWENRATVRHPEYTWEQVERSIDDS